MSRRGVERLFYHLEERRRAPAFGLDEEVRTFGEIDDRGRRYAAGLRALGVKKGDRVVVVMESSLSLVEVLVGHHRLGAVHVPVNTRYRAKELVHIVHDAKPTVVVVGAEMAARAIVAKMELPESVRAVVVQGAGALEEGEVAFERVVAEEPLEELPELADEDRALFIYTSGTTGPSKGVVHTYGSVVAGIEALTGLWEWTTEDRLVLALPLFHVHGLCIGVHGTLLRGNQAQIQPRFEAAEVARAMGRGGTIFMGVPTMHRRLVTAMEEDGELAKAMGRARLITSGSAALRADVFDRYEALTGQRVLERYGMSETLLTISNPYEGERRRGAVGFAVPGTTVRVVDEAGRPVGAGEVGEVQVKGPSVMQGYWGLAQKTAEAFTADGFFKTGDVARQDNDGYIYLVGRGSVDIIKCGGFKVSAREIEEVLREHPDVEDVGVVGVPDEEWGQRIAVAVVPKPRQGADRDEADWVETLAEICRGRLAAYKQPRQAAIYPEGLPRNALGKVQKHRIVRDLR